MPGAGWMLLGANRNTVTKDIWYSEHIKKSPETYHLVLLRNPWRSNVVHLMFFSSVSLGLQVALYLFKFFFGQFSGFKQYLVPDSYFSDIV